MEKVIKKRVKPYCSAVSCPKILSNGVKIGK